MFRLKTFAGGLIKTLNFLNYPNRKISGLFCRKAEMIEL